jgi:hypothetical protein
MTEDWLELLLVGRRSPSDPDSYDLRLTRRAVRHGYKIEYANDTKRKAQAVAEAAAGGVTQASGGSGASGDSDAAEASKKDQ